MFTKVSKDVDKAINTDFPGKLEKPAKPAPPSILSTDLHIVGNLRSAGEIQVDGKIDGDIRTVNLLVGETADINGEIVADKVIVHGAVTGQIKARSVTLAKTAHVVGDILHEDLSINAGAFLEGLCKRITEKLDIIGGGQGNGYLKDPKKPANNG
mgnify:CR=1 FL=1